jgi:magnesium chelatase family protein
VTRYQGRLSGPLLDRIDMQVEVPALPAADLMATTPAEPGAVVAARVAAARERQWQRQGVTNSEITVGDMDRLCALAPAAATFLRQAAERLGWSGRSLHRVMKLARTLADLGGCDDIGVVHLAEAIQYRRALPGGATA